ncbi:hypothetical protein [Aquimarina algiphila]|uniref:Uncharacterized protein n=1 Tax=Aquimarina algiphila TaxID=2047982 RepID=A0A554VDI5_9FLAO|nr:hypothetical protein [Aquimarina algiphila]TSE04972.1 hypothetical protein FOF46_24410 [Aquimarina algiphila]
MKKISLKHGQSGIIEYNELKITTNLNIYDKSSAAHLIGDISLEVQNNGESIASFYINNDPSESSYYTKAYKKYFLTFLIENSNYYLSIEPIRLGKTFALLNTGSIMVGDKSDLEIELIDCYHEWGYDGPPEDKDRKYFDTANYTLKVITKDTIKSFNFYDSIIKNKYTIALENYTIDILSDRYTHTSCLLEMIINKK